MTILISPAPPLVPQVVVTSQLEQVRDVCTISSVLVSPTDPAEANATNYIVNVDGSDVLLKRSESVSSDGVRYSTLVYESSCGAQYNITIAANNTCGQSPDAYEMLYVTFNSANNIHSKSFTNHLYNIVVR